MHHRYVIIFYCADQARHQREVWAISREQAVAAVLQAHPQAVSAYVAACS